MKVRDVLDLIDVKQSPGLLEECINTRKERRNPGIKEILRKLHAELDAEALEKQQSEEDTARNKEATERVIKNEDRLKAIEEGRKKAREEHQLIVESPMPSVPEFRGSMQWGAPPVRAQEGNPWMTTSLSDF